MKRYILLAAMTAVLGAQASATLTLLTDRSQLTPTADLGISQFGAELATVPNGSVGLTTGDVFQVGITAPGDMQRLNQDTSWGGNFAPNEPLLFTNNLSGPVTLNLAKSAFAIGMDVERNQILQYHVHVEAFDGLGVSLGSFDSASVYDDTIFVGVRNTDNTILSVTYEIVPDADTSPTDFAFNHVSIECCPAVPEPASMVVLGGASLLALRRRRKV